jgi:nitroimidazol reductase NimA-like FMN-containing flavoprotein (pyridoxamine 5'-phosphate oxidase superfamily)
MALSTDGEEGLWVNPVFFAWSKDFNLYFISELDCRHMKNIQSSPLVACAIYSTNQGNDVFGAYFKGNAEIIDKDHANWEKADKTYYDRVYPDDPNWEQRKSPDCYRQKESWHLVQIKPTEMSYFDTRYFEENRVNVPMIWS